MPHDTNPRPRRENSREREFEIKKSVSAETDAFLTLLLNSDPAVRARAIARLIANFVAEAPHVQATDRERVGVEHILLLAPTRGRHAELLEAIRAELGPDGLESEPTDATSLGVPIIHTRNGVGLVLFRTGEFGELGLDEMPGSGIWTTVLVVADGIEAFLHGPWTRQRRDVEISPMLDLWDTAMMWMRPQLIYTPRIVIGGDDALAASALKMLQALASQEHSFRSTLLVDWLF